MLPKAILIDVIEPQTSEREAQRRLCELESLVNTYGGIVVVKTIQKKSIPDYETYIGKGKVGEIMGIAEEKGAEILIVNNLLKPRQIYELNERFGKAKSGLKAWDRIDLILKIFSKHAKSTEAKLQIELASIKHMGPRIFGMGIELSRQAGATGVRAGSGEANIEMMKRHLQKRELAILKKLKHYEVIREGHRKRRRRQKFKTVAVVGYTNAGKSSLLNALTGKGTYVADQLFATLDTRVGKLWISESKREVLISDTIGFIRDLPAKLIKAFKSTLAETVEADLLLHVVDINDPEMEENIKVVENVLDELSIRDKPKIYVFNKIDLIKRTDKKLNESAPKKSLMKAGKETARILGWNEESENREISFDSLGLIYKKFSPVFLSAKEKKNLGDLVEKIDEKLKAWYSNKK